MAAFLQIEGILYEYIALNLSPKVDVVTYDITLDVRTFAYNDTALALDLALEGSVDTDIAWREDLTLDDCTSGNPADCIFGLLCHYLD